MRPLVSRYTLLLLEAVMCVVAHFGVSGVDIAIVIIRNYLVPYRKWFAPYTASFKVTNLSILHARHV